MKIIKISEEQPWLFPVEEIEHTKSQLHIAEKIVNDALHDEDIVLLFHSASAFENDEIIKYGLIAQFGDWVEECLHSATDCEELMEEIKNKSEAVFLSKAPSWVISKAKRAAKDFNGSDRELVEKFGQLCLCTFEADSSDIYEAKGKDFSYYGNATSLSGETLYSEEMPFGVEEGDTFSPYDVGVDITLVGKDLVLFLERNFPEHCSWL